MTNRVEEVEIPAGSTLRVGVPADQPAEAIAALTELFKRKGNVQWAGLGLMEVVYLYQKNEISYTIGIECSGSMSELVMEAMAVLASVPPARWPISIVSARSQFFPKDAQPFFGTKPTPSRLHRILHFDLNSLWSNRKK